MARASSRLAHVTKVFGSKIDDFTHSRDTWQNTRNAANYVDLGVATKVRRDIVHAWSDVTDVVAKQQHHWAHLAHTWHRIEVPFVVEKMEFYGCKHVSGGCTSRQDALFNPSPHPGGLTGKMVKKSAAPSGGSTYAPVTNPWGGGFFE